MVFSLIGMDLSALRVATPVSEALTMNSPLAFFARIPDRSNDPENSCDVARALVCAGMPTPARLRVL
eukprot:1283180-Pleurochrysis_carterae.AAC.1